MSLRSYCAVLTATALAFVGCAESAKQPAAPASATADSEAFAVGGDLQAEQTEFNTEAYAHIEENPFLATARNPLSTFSIDVDAASYANVRRFLNDGQLPPPSAVRTEEMINYFDYDDSPPEGDVPFAVHTEAAVCPWKPEHWLVRIGLKGRVIDLEERPASNLVFLLDVSGSMEDHNKLPLVKTAMTMLLDQLDERDRVAIVVYASQSGLVLPSTSAAHKAEILDAITRLHAGGSTNGGEGIELAYRVAAENFIKGGTNRVILCTDGDFNVGTTSQGELVRLIERKAKTGVFLSVFGFGTGNLKDSTMELLADKGNGNYGYIDSLSEAEKVFVEEMSGTLLTIAKDVKIQVDFNPMHVQAYRLIGYENRLLRDEDFRNDAKDAGEIGAGHTVTALYELVPPGVEIDLPVVEPSEYRTGDVASTGDTSNLLTVRLRYKLPEADTSTGFKHAVPDGIVEFAKASEDFRFAAAVAEFAMLLRGSKYRGDSSYTQVLATAAESLGRDAHGHRSEFLVLAGLARTLDQRSEAAEGDGAAVGLRD